MQPRRPTSLTVIAVFHFVLGGLGLLCGMTALAGQAAGGAGRNPFGPPPGGGNEQQKELEDFQKKVAQARRRGGPAPEAGEFRDPDRQPALVRAHDRRRRRADPGQTIRLEGVRPLRRRQPGESDFRPPVQSHLFPAGLAAHSGRGAAEAPGPRAGRRVHAPHRPAHDRSGAAGHDLPGDRADRHVAAGVCAAFRGDLGAPDDYGDRFEPGGRAPTPESTRRATARSRPPVTAKGRTTASAPRRADQSFLAAAGGEALVQCNRLCTTCTTSRIRPTIRPAASQRGRHRHKAHRNGAAAPAVDKGRLAQTGPLRRPRASRTGPRSACRMSPSIGPAAARS